jgi:hypothetical protein
MEKDKLLFQRSPKKCLTKSTGSENLRHAIDEYWERFDGKGRVKK